MLEDIWKVVRSRLDYDSKDEEKEKREEDSRAKIPKNLLQF